MRGEGHPRHQRLRVWPKPVWFTTHRTAHQLTPLLTKFESGPSFANLPAITRWVLGG